MQGLLTSKSLAEYLSVSTTFIQDRRANGDWKEHIHWIYLNPKCKQAGVRYIPELCLHWIWHQERPEKHLAYCAEFQQTHKLSA